MKIVFYEFIFSHISILLSIEHPQNVTPLPPGEEAAHRPLCEFPGGGAEGCGP